MSLTPPQIEAVLSLLGDPDEDIVSHIQRKLHKMGPEAVEEILSAAPPDSAAQREAARVMAWFRGPTIEERFQALAGGNADLEEGAIAIARIGYPGLHPSAIPARLDRMAAELAPDVAPDDHPVRLIRAFNEFLFGRCRFKGAFDYTSKPDPDDSFLNSVMDRKRGLPIALSALYILMGRRIDVPFEGVNTPNHFFVRLARPDEDDILVDPFAGGRVLTRNECAVRVGRPVSDDDLRPVPDRLILMRMLANLIAAYTARNDNGLAEKVAALLHILNTNTP